MSENIPKHEKFKLYFDNWFSTLQLLLKLESTGIMKSATFDPIQLKGDSLIFDKVFQRRVTNIILIARVTLTLDCKCP